MKVSVKPFQRLAVSKGRAFCRSPQTAKSGVKSAIIGEDRTAFPKKTAKTFAASPKTSFSLDFSTPKRYNIMKNCL